MQAVSETQTLVIGAGPAGLASGACLRRAGLPFVLLEQANTIASSWRGHYERLHLHTDREHSSLPYLRFPRGTPRYPSRDQVVSYLEQYAAHFGLRPLFGCRVSSLRRAASGWNIETSTGGWRARRVILATGTNAQPHLPAWPGREHFKGPLIHSRDYRNGAPFHGQRVLVVGFGNSAGEIAVDLHEHGARVLLAVRGAVNVAPRDILGLPILSVSLLMSALPPRLADALSWPLVRASIGDIETLGLRRSASGPMTQIAAHGRVPLLDHGTLRLIRQGHIEVAGEVAELDAGGVRFGDGSWREVAAIVAATGYRSSLASLLAPAELPPPASKARRPDGSAERGLYFCGFAVSATGMLRDIGIEARRIAQHIAAAAHELQRFAVK